MQHVLLGPYMFPRRATQEDAVAGSRRHVDEAAMRLLDRLRSLPAEEYVGTPAVGLPFQEIWLPWRECNVCVAPLQLNVTVGSFAGEPSNRCRAMSLSFRQFAALTGRPNSSACACSYLTLPQTHTRASCSLTWLRVRWPWFACCPP